MPEREGCLHVQRRACRQIMPSRQDASPSGMQGSQPEEQGGTNSLLHSVLFHGPRRSGSGEVILPRRKAEHPHREVPTVRNPRELPHREVGLPRGEEDDPHVTGDMSHREAHDPRRACDAAWREAVLPSVDRDRSLCTGRLPRGEAENPCGEAKELRRTGAPPRWTARLPSGEGDDPRFRRVAGGREAKKAGRDAGGHQGRALTVRSPPGLPPWYP